MDTIYFLNNYKCLMITYRYYTHNKLKITDLVSYFTLLQLNFHLTFLSSNDSLLCHLVKWWVNNCIQSYAVALTVWLSWVPPPLKKCMCFCLFFSTSRQCVKPQELSDIHSSKTGSQTGLIYLFTDLILKFSSYWLIAVVNRGRFKWF